VKNDLKRHEKNLRTAGRHKISWLLQTPVSQLPVFQTTSACENVPARLLGCGP
jgi:hypothetical protein